MTQVFDMEPAFLSLWDQCRTQTMTSIERGYALFKAVEHIAATAIPGAFAECGVWRGGSAMLIALSAQHFGVGDRAIWLYDTFDGMTPPTDADQQAMTGRSAAAILAGNARDTDNPFWGVAPRDVVAANMAKTFYPAHLVHLVEGDVLDTLPAHAPGTIALLRLDTDWYESTAHELATLYPRLSPGGVLIIDDYGYWSGARKAVDDYFAALGAARPMLQRIDFTGRIAIKLT
ncbi:MAG: TylF/MycF/NovP-related O-methyltransferase [Pseudomonadota bacterium]